jgi:vacuolar-type H+-ATPase subunit E/Vma4
MKNMLLLPLVFGVMMGCSDQKDVDLSATSKQAEVHKAISADPFMIMDFATTSGNPEVQKLVDASLEEYKNLVINIRQEFSVHRQEVKTNFESNIAEFEKGIADQEKEYKASCTDINAANLDGCNTFGEKLGDIKNQLGELNARYQTQLKKVDSDEKTQLSKFQAQMKNNVNALLSQAN